MDIGQEFLEQSHRSGVLYNRVIGSGVLYITES